MTTQTAPQPGSEVPLFSVAGSFLEGLAAQDFARLAATLDDGAHMTGLVPSGFKEWDGPEEITATFRRWFGEVAGFDLVDAVVGEVGPRLYLRWRGRVHHGRLGEDWLVVEQQVYADTGSDGRIHRLFLLCSGFWPETTAAVAR